MSQALVEPDADQDIMHSALFHDTRKMVPSASVLHMPKFPISSVYYNFVSTYFMSVEGS
ncbi:hypothetical protein BD626DRAFT_567421 [Schizophyllum amplum]|uniref:Uncharacterized protein n=1 Tax=Schizophyllum amplum TaxID=97359 RepID=A0A550CL76_9AGAR|nr:hypothetical protein BD626DRAFT_567421 [Auriculariopsis ampla]